MHYYAYFALFSFIWYLNVFISNSIFVSQTAPHSLSIKYVYEIQFEDNAALQILILRSRRDLLNNQAIWLIGVCLIFAHGARQRGLYEFQNFVGNRKLDPSNSI